ncbi:phospholipase [Pikeienuella piscinae]|uniref:Phospholipase D n=1 Tax=Pikeienuella piscinae TaxID=2748098 RepID=A0A7L5BW13_9RHOB|nr:phospholipase D-like domain-containing protein [Pikeienuella piscinae]QIE54074.1 phospholipase [Pikeienuella piscinae]
MPIEIGDRIKFHLGPDTAAPGLDDLEAAIVDFIDGATKRLDIAVQELESRPILEAILRAEIERKVQVRMVLEADYLVANRRPKTVAEAFESAGPREANRLLAAAALRTTIWLRSDFNPHIFHQKFIIRDGESVLTGSTNFTPTGVGRARQGGNLNHVITIESREIAKIYSREFSDIAKGNFGRDSTHSDHPPEIVVDGVRFKICFAPEHNPEMEIAKRINKAMDRIDFAIFTFSQSSAIDDAMEMAMRAGVKIAGALDGMQGNQAWAPTRRLIQEGADLKRVKKDYGRVNKLHHKMMVIDEATLVIGSFNYTGPANLVNDENIIVITSDDACGAALPLIRGARAEIERIICAHGSSFNFN